MGGVTKAVEAANQRRKAVLDGIVAEAFAEQDAIAEVRAVRKRRKAGEIAKLREDEKLFRVAQQDANNAVGDIIQGIEAACEAIDRWDAAAAQLVRAPGVVPYLAKISRRRRFGNWLSRRLYDKWASDQLGVIRLNACGNRRPTRWADDEAQLLERLRLSLFHPLSDDEILTNGVRKPNGHIASPTE